MTEHHFCDLNVLELLYVAAGYDDQLPAHVAVNDCDGHFEVELTPVEDGETLIGTERFRVTVERIGDDR